jgi:hypothetical protein
MRFLFFVLPLFICASPFSRVGFSQSASSSNSGEPGRDGADAFVEAWKTLQKAEKLELAHNYKDSLSTFREGATMLERISKDYPNWSPTIVNYRKNHTAEAIVRVKEELASGIPAKGFEGPRPRRLHSSFPDVSDDSPKKGGG